jgi:high affinity Mn2+ porin
MRRTAPLATLTACVLCACVPARADDAVVAAHAQATYVEQQSDRFRAPYAGANSLVPDQGRQTADVTLYLGVRPWSGAELWVDPELDQGFGLADTLGLAGFASGEAYKVGRARPYLRWQRLMLRQTWNLGPATSEAAAGANQFAAALADERVVLTVGKFGVGDVFDANRYAHDPRGDFLNWSLLDTGTFDYAADAWGYTVGAALEWYRGPWTWRGGVFDLSDVPNSPHLEPGLREFQTVVEAEHRHDVGGRAGKLAVTVFRSRARMARLAEAVARGADAALPPDPVPVRRLRDRWGIAINAEQELAPGVGAFLRAGESSGNVETYDFTDIDRSVAVGASIAGTSWRRTDDVAGVAVALNGIGPARRAFLAAGGLGVLVGDGRLPESGNERIVEAYYRLAIVPGRVHLTLDRQWVRHPAYNAERGPVGLWALRVHADY